MPEIKPDARARIHDIPDGMPILRTSERTAWKDCPQKWWWSYREGYTVNWHETPNALWFGIGWHEAMAHFYAKGYKRNMDFIDLWDVYAEDSMRQIAVSQSGNWDDKDWVEAKELGHAMLTGYLEKYGKDPDWDVVYTEEPFDIEIPRLDSRGRATDDTEIVFVSTFDGVYRHRKTKRFHIMEHKTAAAITDVHLDLDDQGGAYFAVASQVLHDKGILGPRENIDGITYNFARKAMPDPRPKDREGYATNKPTKTHYMAALEAAGYTLGGKETLADLEAHAAAARVRVTGERSASQPKPLFERFEVHRTPRERSEQIRRISREAAVMNGQRTGELPLWKRPTRDCSWKCQFYQMCQLHDRGEDVDEFAKLAFTRKDPYADRRKSASD